VLTEFIANRNTPPPPPSTGENDAIHYWIGARGSRALPLSITNT
jgi:hypothetical protein